MRSTNTMSLENNEELNGQVGEEQVPAPEAPADNSEAVANGETQVGADETPAGEPVNQ